jgi:hypothetical protein
MKQENKQPGKKSRVLSITAAGLLTVATIGGVAMGVTSCEQPTGSGGNGGNGGGGGNEQQEKVKLGEPVWSGNITWTYVTDRESTEFIPGEGHKEGIEQGTQSYTDGSTATVTRKVEDPNKEIFIIPAKKIMDPVTGAFKDRVKEEEGNKDKDKVPQYNGGSAAVNVNTVNLVGIVHNDLTNGEAASVTENISAALRSQAEKLREFFADAETNFTNSTNYPTLAAKFATLKGAEADITTILGTGLAVKDRPGQVISKGEAILDAIFTDRTEFNKYFEAYKLGHYIASRDWATEPLNNRATLNKCESDFADLLDAIGKKSEILEQGSVGVSLRGDGNVKIGSHTSAPSLARDRFDYCCTELENQMVARIVTALGITGAEQSKVEAMARALVIQLGQDHQEFKAFVNDLQAEQTNYTVSYTILDRTDIAQVGPQSNIKLASVNPEKGVRRLFG